MSSEPGSTDCCFERPKECYWNQAPYHTTSENSFSLMSMMQPINAAEYWIDLKLRKLIHVSNVSTNDTTWLDRFKARTPTAMLRSTPFRHKHLVQRQDSKGASWTGQWLHLAQAAGVTRPCPHRFATRHIHAYIIDFPGQLPQNLLQTSASLEELWTLAPVKTKSILPLYKWYGFFISGYPDEFGAEIFS